MVEVATSILSIDKENAIKTLYNIETAKTDYFHIDVMDGKFVKDNTNDVMLEYCEYLNSITTVPLDVHLMVEDVEQYIKSYLVFEPNNITFHYEATKNEEELKKWIDLLKENNCKVGISIKPETPVEKIYKLLPYVHLVLVMTVEPGEGGQKLIDDCVLKIQKLKQYIDENNLDVYIEADGGINTENANMVKEAGADMLVSGSAIINAEDYKEIIIKLKG